MKTLALKPWQWCLIAAIAVLFFLFVWPTPYQIEVERSGYDQVYRVNRFTGKLQRATPEGWR